MVYDVFGFDPTYRLDAYVVGASFCPLLVLFPPITYLRASSQKTQTTVLSNVCYTLKRRLYHDFLLPVP